MSVRAAATAAVTASLLLLAACGQQEQENDTPPPTSEPSPTASEPPTGSLTPSIDEEIASGLNVPWGLVFREDGTALVAQRDAASIVAIAPGGDVTDLGEVEGVVPGGEGGLLGLALSPDESTLYAYLTAAQDNRVVAMPLDGDELGEPTPILTGISKANHHNGGALLYDPDDEVLFVATGDASNAELAQDETALEGKILRITPEGAPAEGNPFGNEIWSLGHRNVQGLAFDGDGRLWSSEFGDKGADELNLIEAGGNYGWPVIEGESDDDRFVEPVVTWPVEDASPSGLAIVGDTAYLGALRGQRLWAVPLEGDSAGEPVESFVEELGRVRAVAAAPDGSLWLGTSNTDGRLTPGDGDDRLLRLDVRDE